MGNSLKTSLFHWNLRVYYEDTDLAGVVYYANYLKFYERARTEWLRSLGLENGRLKDQEQIVFVVSQCNIRYLSPARIDDQLVVTVDSCVAQRASTELVQSVWRGGDQKLLNQATVRFASVDAITYKPRRLPSVISNN